MKFTLCLVALLVASVSAIDSEVLEAIAEVEDVPVEEKIEAAVEAEESKPDPLNLPLSTLPPLPPLPPVTAQPKPTYVPYNQFTTKVVKRIQPTYAPFTTSKTVKPYQPFWYQTNPTPAQRLSTKPTQWSWTTQKPVQKISTIPPVSTPKPTQWSWTTQKPVPKISTPKPTQWSWTTQKPVQRISTIRPVYTFAPLKTYTTTTPPRKDLQQTGAYIPWSG